MNWNYRATVVVILTVTAIGVTWLETGKWWIWDKDASTHPVPSRRHHVFQENIQVGQIESNCGLRNTCEGISVPVFLHTGDADDLRPQLCIGGKYLIQRGVNGGGRGLNAAILEPAHFQVVSVRNFDTYRQDSATDMDSWLDEMLDDDILIIFSTDEASARLNQTTRTILNNLGSGKVQDLSFRAQWFLITQKGGKGGFSRYEEISYPGRRSWGDGLKFHGCVPRIVPKEHVSADPSPRDTSSRDLFCYNKTDDIYMPLCTQSRFQSFSPALLTNRSLIGNMVYSMPIYLFAGDEFEVYIATLDSLIHQPGVLVSGITVLYQEGQIDVAEAAKVYNVKSVPTSGLKAWPEMVEVARQLAKTRLPKPNYFIVIDRDSIPSPDFLFYFAQTGPTLQKDTTVSAISAWSANCYEHDGDNHAAFRVHGFPKYAGLFRLNGVDGDIIAPDVPRIQGSEACHTPSLYADNWIERPQDLTQERYFHKLVIFQQRSTTVDLMKLLSSCSTADLKEGGNFVLYYRDDEELLLRIINCLGVQRKQFGRYQTLVRVTAPSKAAVLLINSNSTFFKARPIA